MARGWESKSVEEQINERQGESKSPEKAKVDPKRESIRLARSRTLTALESSHDARYRALLERTLAYLDSELAKLD